MHEIVKVPLDNEMDLILAHKRSMKLSELVGFSLATQTTFATAISEVSRQALAHGAKAVLTLSLSQTQPTHWCIVAQLTDQATYPADALASSLNYARRLVNDASIDITDDGIRVQLCLNLRADQPISAQRIEQLKKTFKEQPALSPYDELKQRNRQLQSMAERLTQSEANYQVLTDSLPLMIFTAGQTGKLRYANEWLTQFTGETLQTLNQTNWKSVVHADDWAQSWAAWPDHIRPKKPFQVELRIRQASTGMYIWHLLSATPVRPQEPSLSYWTGFLADINAQKLMSETLKDNQSLREAKLQLEMSQQALERTNLELKHSNDNLQQFAYIASHDLQEPLRKVQAFGDVLRQQYGLELGTNGLDLITRMESAAVRMSVLIKDLLAYSRITTHREPMRPVDLNKVVSDVLADLSQVVKETGATITLGSLPTLPGDSRQLRQLFQNLLSNALRYHKPIEAPSVWIDCCLVSGAELPDNLSNRTTNGSEPTYYRISVSDAGIGFDEKYLDRIFQVFQRLHGRNQYPGTGVGLAICRRVVENHQGVLTATSQPGKGASFIIYLPA